MLKIKSYDVYGLERAVKASGLPMSVDGDKVEFSGKRGAILGNARSGSGHDCFLKGIVVEARIKYPLYWSKQFQRYHFADIVSSQSTMHRVTKMDLRKSCNEWVDPIIIQVIERKVHHYNVMIEEGVDYLYISDFEWMLECDVQQYPAEVEKVTKEELFMQIISCLPSGFEMEMEIVTNYLQLKTIYQQRRNHKLPDWHVFCSWVESLPRFKDFCLGGNK